MLKLKYSVPNGFLKEETRRDYTISETMKKAWAVQMDLLQELLRVCNEHGLRVFADSGTLIGAVREKGFIPWDDDIDVAMLRNDYDKLTAMRNCISRAPRQYVQTENLSATSRISSSISS